MIVVVGRVRTGAEKRAEFLRIGQAVAVASRQEAGCIGYRLYEDTEVEHDFVSRRARLHTIESSMDLADVRV